jgi:hypothetical protein
VDRDGFIGIHLQDQHIPKRLGHLNDIRTAVQMTKLHHLAPNFPPFPKSAKRLLGCWFGEYPFSHYTPFQSYWFCATADQDAEIRLAFSSLYALEIPRSPMMGNKTLDRWISYPTKQLQPCSDFLAWKFFKERVLDVPAVREIFGGEQDWQMLVEVISHSLVV